MKRSDLSIFEITETHLRILRARFLPDRSLQVFSLDALKIEQSSRENLSKILASVVTSKDKKSQVVVVLPRSQVIFKNFSLPSHSKEELKKMIGLQMATQVPYAREDIVFDYSVLGQDLLGYTKILSAVVHKEVIDEFSKMFKSAGLTIQQFVLSSSSVARWFCIQYPQEVEKDKKTVGILNVESVRSEFCFACHGQLVYAREIKYGRRDVGGDFEDLFLKDIFLTLEAYLREHAGDTVQKIFILAPAAIHGLLLERIQAQKKIIVELIDPFAVIKQNKNMVISAIFQAEDLSPIVCLGAAQESMKPSLDLLPEEVQKSQRMAAQKWQIFQLVLLVVVNLALFFLIFFQAFYKDQAYLNDLKLKASKMHSRVEDVKRQAEQLKEIESRINPRISTVDIVYSLYDMTPKEISFQLLSLDKEGNLTIQGIAETRSSVNDFHRRLTNNPLFENASLQYAAQRRFFEGEITDFKITAVVSQRKEP
ncbi:MAG: pilus assembly protein PilM [Candidatus Omnitrophota bacterium]